MSEHLRDMALFVEIARSGSFSRAAKSLGLPLSTLSRRFSEFEKHIGLQLINRDTRKLELTSTGTAYFAECAKLVDAASVAHERLRQGRDDMVGSLRISLTPDFGTLIFAPVLIRFARKYPALTFDLDLTPNTVDLIANNIDVAIRFGEPADSSITMRSLGSIQHGIYAAPAYLESAGHPSHPSELSGHAGLRIRHATRARYDHMMCGEETATIELSERFNSNNLSLICKLAIAGMGIAVMPEVVAFPAYRTGALIRILPAWSFIPTPVLALTPTRLMPARCRVFLDYLGAHADELLDAETSHETGSTHDPAHAVAMEKRFP